MVYNTGKIVILSLMMVGLLIFSSCNNDIGGGAIEDDSSNSTENLPVNESELCFLEQPVSLSAVLNQSSIIHCKAVSGNKKVYYRWFEYADNNVPVWNNWSENSDLEVTFTEYGMKFFICGVVDYCPSTDEMPDNILYSNVVCIACTGLPTLKVDTGDIDSALITKEDYVPCTCKIIMSDGTETVYSLTEKGIKGRGNSTWLVDKKGYNLNFDKKVQLFGYSKSKKWCLIANYSDKSLLRNKYVSILGKEIYNTEYQPSMINVDFVLNGKYQGNYIFSEKIDIETDRIDIQDISDVEENLLKLKSNKITDSNGDGTKDLFDGGFVMEIDDRLDADFHFITNNGIPVTLKDPDEVAKTVQKHIESIVTKAETVLYSSDFTDNTDGWRKYFDESSFIDWYIVNEFAKNYDSHFCTSVYMYYNPSDGKIHFGPNWDYDMGFGIQGLGDCNNPEGWWIKNAGWISRLYEDSVFVEHIKERWNERKNNLYDSILSIQELADTNALSATLDFWRWNYSEKNYYIYIESLKEFCLDRYTWLDSAINDL